MQTKIIMRWRDDVTTADRIYFRGEYYNILAVLRDERSGVEHMTLMASSGVRGDRP